MTKNIKLDSVDFNALIKNSTTLTLNTQSKMVEILNEEFTQEESRWYIANLYVYMNYHPTNDYPINLDTLVKLVGFAHKKNAKTTLENNFIKDEDYKILLTPKGKQVKTNGGAGLNKEQIMLNVDTFKNMCMLVKTEKSKQIRKYYVKLENIYNKIIKEEIEEKQIEIESQKLLLEKEKENSIKLLQEKDKYIAELKDKQVVPILYIAHNPIIKNKHKIGISSETKTNDILVRKENHKSSNPDFEFLFTYETPNAKLIEDLIKLLLKPFKLQKPEWFSITYEKMKRVVDFAIMVYDNYHIEDSLENLIEFVSRYRSNRLINTNKARIHISKDIYEDWIKENVIMIPDGKISSELICSDFYEWYKLKYPEKIENVHIKLETGNWSTSFQKEITNAISDITKLEYKGGISFSDRKRGIYFPKCAGFLGFEVKSMNKKLEFFDKVVYETYIQEFITITNNPKHKVARKEILDHFLVWVKNNNFVSKNRIMCRTSISSIFKDVLIENIENITGLKIQDVCKLTYFGCFTCMTHSKFPFVGNESTPKELVKNSELIKSQIDNWIKTPLTKIAQIFQKCIKENNKISIVDVKTIMNSKYNIDLTLNKRKTNWHLVFEKDNENFYIKQQALDYYNLMREQLHILK